MAEDKTSTYPRVAKGSLIAIRNSFKKRIPSVVSIEHIAMLLNTQEKTARADVLPALARFGLIDENNKPTERVYDWADDTKYQSVCKAIIQEVYPTSLHDLAPEFPVNRSDLVRWFQRYAKVGESAAHRMAAIYELLLEADPNKVQDLNTSQNNAKEKKPKKTPPNKPDVAPVLPADIQKEPTIISQQNAPRRFARPSIHLDIQIHVSPNSTPEQIDLIFASMAKHFSSLLKPRDDRSS